MITTILANWKLILIGLLLAALGMQTVRIAGAQKETAEVRTDLADYKATAAETARLAERAERHEEQRYQTNTRKVIDESRNETALARAAAGRADAAAGRLSRQLAAFRAALDRASQDPAAAGRGSGEPGADPIGVLADVLGRADARAGIVERYADTLRIVGATCERYADGLQPPAQ